MSKIYVVVEGEYSSYHIVGIYSDKRLAKKMSKTVPESSIEEYPLDPGAEELNAGLKYYNITYRDGEWGCQLIAPFDDYDYVIDVDSKIRTYRGDLYIKTWAKNKKHALKIGSELRAQYVAMKGSL